MSDDWHSDADSCDRPFGWLPQTEPPLLFDCDRLSLNREQSRLRIILIGYLEDVNQEILNLYHCGYEVSTWSPPQRIPGSEEVISVYLKRSRRIGGWSDL